MPPRLLAALALTFLVACAPRGGIVLDPSARAIGNVQRVYVGTTRQEDPQAGAWSFGRDFEAKFARFDISLPPDRDVGSVTFPPKNGAADPRKHMVTVEAHRFEGPSDFKSDLAKSMQSTRRGSREAVVFVHGFNNTFAEGLYRFAQLNHDLELPGTPVHYAWPSRGSVLGYAYDRDSAMFARDGLESLLNQVSEAGADRIVLIGHSMGAHLTMETLRQISMRGNQKVLSRLAGVVLMSPDIDVDVFRAQAQGTGKLPQPFVIFSSGKDKALSVSAMISGESERLGNLTDVSRLAGLEVTLLDVAAFSTGDGHFDAAKSPALIQILGRVGDISQALNADDRSRVGLLPGAVLSVQGATRVILNPVQNILMQ